MIKGERETNTKMEGKLSSSYKVNIQRKRKKNHMKHTS